MSGFLQNNIKRQSMSAPVEVSIHHHDPFLYVERQARQLQRDFQTLLDAQNAGLTAGLSGPAQDDVSSNRSSTPTPSQLTSPRSATTVPIRQPLEKKFGLRSARRGILKTMNDLLCLKEEERRIIGSELSERREALKEVDKFVNKRRGLEKTISEIRSDGEKLKAENLAREARVLETDIRELETRLMEMKARHRYMVNEISQIQNSIDSKLSSYTASLSLVDGDIEKYLRSPPLQPLATRSAAPSLFYSMNPTRRTLDMAREHWKAEQAQLRKRQRNVDFEIDALKEGGGVWQTVVLAVTKFEKMLREEMKQSVQVPCELLGQPQEGIDEVKAQAILKEMDDTTAQLEMNLQLAERKGWNLLICSIGAELEAFREAKVILLASLRTHKEQEATAVGKASTEFGSGSREDLLATPTDARQLNEHPTSPLKDRAKSSSQIAPSRSEDEDDEPDPAWLMS
jgi:hypothetical protein